MFHKIALVMLLLLSGCAAVKSSKVEMNKASEEGVVYYLPKKLLKFEIVRALAPTKQDQSKATAALNEAKEAQKTAKDARDEAERLVKATTAGTPARAEAEKSLALKTAALKLADDSVQEAKDALLEVIAKNAAADGGTPQLTDSITITVLPSVADTTHRYSASPHHLITRSDKLELRTTAAGLLTSATGKSEDKLGDILIAISQSISSVQARTANDWKISHNTESSPPAKTVDCGNGLSRAANSAPTPFKMELAFDPTEGATKWGSIPGIRGFNPWTYLESALCAKGADYKFVWNAVGADLTGAGTPAQDANLKAWPGILYRRALPYQLAIFSASGDGASKAYVPLRIALVELPNGSPPELLDYKAGGFTTTDLVAEFQDGMLVSHSITRPSEALAVVKIPYEIAKALISIPAEIFKLRVDYSTQEAALIDAKAKVIKSKVALDAEEEKAKDK